MLWLSKTKLGKACCDLVNNLCAALCRKLMFGICHTIYMENAVMKEYCMTLYLSR